MRARQQKQRIHLAYVRVSTEEQSREGVSLAAQESRIRAYCAAMDRELTEVIIDAGISAKSLDRPGIRRILSMLKRGEVESVTVFKLDRLTRSLRDLTALVDLFLKADCALVSVSERLDLGTASGRLMMHVLGALSEWERGVIAERTSEAMTHLRRTGSVYSPAPYGYCRDGSRLVEDPQEQSLLSTMNELRLQGLSFRRIAQSLNEQGYRTRCGSEFWPNTVRSALTSKMNGA